MSTQLVLVSPKKKSSLTLAKVARAVGIFVLGFVVFATKHAIQKRQAEEQKLVRRSAADLVYQTSTLDKDDKKFSKEISSKLRIDKEDNFSLRRKYIIEANPAGYVNKQNPLVRNEFESRLKKKNVTRWQYPDFVHVPLTDLGVVFLNGQRFYQQGTGTPPEFATNSTRASTRTVDHKCPGKGGLGGHKSPTTPPQLQMRALIQVPEEKPQQVGCCNGQPYNTNKRCCCRRATFNKETKFCCAVDGCRNFQIFNRDDPKAFEKCRALEGYVVQEYGYHSV